MRTAIASFLATILISGGALLAAPVEPSILILPFSSVAEEGGTSVALAKGVQQDLAANLAFGKLRIITPNIPAGPADIDGALKAARDADATIVIFGHSQSNGNQLRLTGEVVDVAAGKPIGALKITGASDDLFHMEDILGAQAMWALPPSMRDNQALAKATEIATRVPSPIEPAVATTTSNPTVIVNVPNLPQSYPINQYDPYPANYPTAPYYDPYDYDDYYPGYYGYGYGYYPGSFFSVPFRAVAFRNRFYGRFGLHPAFHGSFVHFHGSFNGGSFHGGFNGGGFHGGFNGGGFGGHR